MNQLNRALAWSAAICVSSAGRAAGPEVVELLAPEVERVSLRAAAATDDLRTIVGWGQRTALSPVEAFRWTEGDGFSWIDPGDPDVRSTAAHGVSPDGMFIVGAATTIAGVAPFRWSQATGFELLSTPDTVLRAQRATGVSADGGVIVGTSYRHLTRNTGFRWTEATGLVHLSDVLEESEANAVSADGRIIVGSLEDYGAAVWRDDEEPVALLGLTAVDVSLDGRYVLQRLDASSVYRIELDLDADSPTIDSVAFVHGGMPGGLSDDGSRAAGAWNGAVIWNEEIGVDDVTALAAARGIDLDAAGWQLVGAVGVTEDLSIVGNGVFQNRSDVWRAHFNFSSCTADRNDDRMVDAVDVAYVLATWGVGHATGGIDGDANEDGVVDGADLSIVLSDWGICRERGRAIKGRWLAPA